jgi:hypothetical protein
MLQKCNNDFFNYQSESITYDNDLNDKINLHFLENDIKLTHRNYVDGEDHDCSNDQKHLRRSQIFEDC